MKVAITGATGYIGTRLLQHLDSKGHKVVALSRSCPEYSVFKWFHFDLGKGDTPLPVSVDALVHLATDTSGAGLGDETEISAVLRLLDYSERCSAIFVFISSQAADENAPTPYGRLKNAIENLVLSRGGLVIRPGLVYGGDEKGLFGSMVRITSLLWVLPAFLPRPRIQPIHIDDLVTGISRLLEIENSEKRVYSLGDPEPKSFTTFIRVIAKYRLRKRKLLVPVPSVLVYALAGLTGDRSVFSRLRSLFKQKTMDTENDLQALGLELRFLESGMQKNERGRRALVNEALVLYEYVLGAKPSLFSTRIYVRAIEKFRDGKPLRLPIVSNMFPASIGVIDYTGKMSTGNELSWRIETASVLAEATHLGSKQFLNLKGPHGFIFSVFWIVYSVLSEFVTRIVRLLMMPLNLFKGFSKSSGS